MTTEISIMNKSAVALAADSAVTIPVWGTDGRKSKVLNTANKLFALSKHGPVGIMIYGSAHLMGVPWETIVKSFRRNLGTNRYSHIDRYCTEFFKFLSTLEMPDGARGEYIRNRALSAAIRLRQDLDTWTDEELKQEDKVTKAQRFEHLKRALDSRVKDLEDGGGDCPLSKAKITKLKKTHSKEIREVFGHFFEEFEFTRTMDAKVVTLVVLEAATCSEWSVPSGIVIAGFGEDEFFPKCRTFEVHAILEGKVIRQLVENKSCDTTLANTATITPFAQSNDVFAFLKGMAPDIENFLIASLVDAFCRTLPNKIADECKAELTLSDKERKQTYNIAAGLIAGVCGQFLSNIRVFQDESFVAPILHGTGSLNPSELATMAETLVNLVSFRKQVTMQDETVGGPIDVAIITKGDGLVWIKRKHYFDPSLNHHFFSNYFGQDSDDDAKKNS